MQLNAAESQAPTSPGMQPVTKNVSLLDEQGDGTVSTDDIPELLGRLGISSDEVALLLGATEGNRWKGNRVEPLLHWRRPSLPLKYTQDHNMQLRCSAKLFRGTVDDRGVIVKEMEQNTISQCDVRDFWTANPSASNRILVVGDSLTAAWFNGDVDHGDPWPAKMPGLPRGTQVFSVGLSGWTTEGMLRKLSELIRDKKLPHPATTPEFYLTGLVSSTLVTATMFGTNDCSAPAFDKKLATMYIVDMNEMVEALGSAGSGPTAPAHHLLVAMPRKPYCQPNHDAVNEMVSDLCAAQRKPWSCVAAEDIPMVQGVTYDLDQDLLHPTHKGYEQWGEALAPHFLSALEAARTSAR